MANIPEDVLRAEDALAEEYIEAWGSALEKSIEEYEAGDDDTGE